MRAATIQALREYFADADDPTPGTAFLGATPAPLSRDNDRLIRLLLRALREIDQDRQALATRVAALEARLAAAGIP